MPVGADDVIVTQTPRAGWAVATDAGETVAIDTSVTPELRREGLAREVIRLVQEARKTDGLDVTDRIALRWSASDPDLAAALAEHGSLIASEVLATEYGPEVETGDAPEHADPELGLRFWLKRAEARGYSGALSGWSGRQARQGVQPASLADPTVIFSRSFSPMKRMRMQWAL